METLPEFMWPITLWHWLALGLVILAIEVSIGTFDLLWIGLAALLTAAYQGLAPAGITGLEYQLAVFTISSIVLVIAGRTVFSGMRNQPNDAPQLNQRMEAMIGQRGTAVSEFQSGAGRVRIGDTEWLGESFDGSPIAEGATVSVEAVDSTKVIVKTVS